MVIFLVKTITLTPETDASIATLKLDGIVQEGHLQVKTFVQKSAMMALILDSTNVKTITPSLEMDVITVK